MKGGRRHGPSGFKPWHHSEWWGRDALLQEFTPSSLEEEQVVEGRYVLVKPKFDTFILFFMNIYVPNNDAKRKSFLEKVLRQTEWKQSLPKHVVMFR